jgi:hypothetical protein
MMVDIMDDSVQVWEPHVGSTNAGVRRLWRRNRNAAYRLAFRESTGEDHPASVGEALKDLEVLLKKTEPPVGMTWKDFGHTWDLHSEHPFTPVLRKQSVDAEWIRHMEETKLAE